MPVPRSETEAVIAEAIAPGAFERKRAGAELPTDRARRRFAIKAAGRVVAALDRMTDTPVWR